MVMTTAERSKVKPLTIPRGELPLVPSIVTLEDLDRYIEFGRRQRFYAEAIMSPDMAKALLDRNLSNRHLSAGVVEKYAEAMRRGEWRLNGQGIVISSTGELNDGQHRLTAVVEADTEVAIGIQFGVERDSRSTLDVGYKRTLGDHLSMAGEKNVNGLAAAIRFGWSYDNDYSLHSSPSVEQMFDYLERNGPIRDAVSDAHNLAKAFKIGLGITGGAYYICARSSPQVALDLLNGAASGLNLTETGSPIYRLRQRYQDHATGIKPLDRYEGSAVFILAFNALRQRRNCRALRWVESGPDAKPFPRAGA